jgi:dipeptidyl aminopeptidase/acylaminoacyl peptidase
VLVSEVIDTASVVEEISLADGRREPLFEGANVDNVLRDPDSGLAIGATLLGAPHGAFFDAKLQARFAGMRKAFPGQRIEFLSFSRKFDHMIALTDGGSDSGTYWLVDIASGAADPIGRMYPEVRSVDVGQVSWVNYKSGDGQDISGTLTLPPGRKPEKLPLIVLASEGTPGNLGFDWRAQAFVAAGYAVFEPGEPERKDAATMSLDHAQLVTNIANGVQELAAQKVVDPTRTCIVGINTGGYSALAAVTLEPGAYRCSVAVAAPSHLPSYLQWLIDKHHYDSNQIRTWHGLFGPDKDIDRRSPAHFAGQASAPVLLIHGKDDTVVPFSQSEKMAASLRSADKPVEFVALDGEDHWLSRGGSRKAMLEASMAFVKKYNPSN